MFVSRDQISDAAQRLTGRVRHTPLLDVDGVTLKLELTQHTGSFKPRGAFNRVLAAPHVPRTGLVTASGGNHGAAVAFVAHELGLPAEVFVPTVTSAAKIDRIRSYGATVIVGGDRYDDARTACETRAAVTEAMIVHAYDHPDVVAGQGTVALELDEQADPFDTLLVAVGGGGLIGGIASWFASRGPRIVAVEPAGIPTLHNALVEGSPVDVPVDGVAADSLGAKRIGLIAFEACTTAAVRSVLVSDDQIVAAQRYLWDRTRLLTEPGGATAFAALHSGLYRPADGERVAVVLCGANTNDLPM